MDYREKFLNLPCKLQKKDGFILHGIVVDINDAGVFFQTDKKTSYIGFCDIAELLPEEGQ